MSTRDFLRGKLGESLDLTGGTLAVYYVDDTLKHKDMAELLTSGSNLKFNLKSSFNLNLTSKNAFYHERLRTFAYKENPRNLLETGDFGVNMGILALG